MSTLSILYIGPVPPHRGGDGVLGCHLITGLAALGHRVRALAPIPDVAVPAGRAFWTRHPSVAVTWFEVPAFSGELPMGSQNERYRPAESRGVKTELPRLIAEERPDVIIVGREATAREVPPVAQHHAIPTVLVMQGGFALLSMLEANPSLASRSLLDRIREMDVTVCVARHLADSAGRLSLRNVTVIPNPVDLHEFAAGSKDPWLHRELAIDPRDVVVCHVSTLIPVKRSLDLAASAPEALAVNPDLVYVIVGDGPDRAALEHALRAYGIGSRFRFVGWVDHALVAGYLRMADIVVMPSAYEAQAFVYLETQACGRLLIASDIPAAREVIAEGETGLLFRLGDIQDLTAKILRAAGDPGLRVAIGRRAREAVRSHAKPQILAAYASLLQDLAR